MPNNYFSEKTNNWVNEDESKLEDCYGRGLWVQCAALKSDLIDQKEKERAGLLIESNLEKSLEFNNPMPQALTMIAISELEDLKSKKLLEKISGNLLFSYNISKSDSWKYPGDEIVYCAGRIPQAFFNTAIRLNNSDYGVIGIESINFLISQTFKDDMFFPIGNKWLKKEKIRSYKSKKQWGTHT